MPANSAHAHDYGERREALVEAVAEMLGDQLEIGTDRTGLHVAGWLAASMDDWAIARYLVDYDIATPPLSAYVIEPIPRGGLVLGCGAVDVGEIRAGMMQIARAFECFRG